MTTSRMQRERYPRQHRHWTEDEEARVLELTRAGKPWATIEKMVGRSKWSIWAHWFSRGERISELRRGIDGCRTVYEVSRLMGVHESVTRRWVNDNELPATKSRGRGRSRYVNDQDLMEFLANRDYWMDWTPENMTDEDWRDYARELRQSTDGRWITPYDLAIKYHVTHHTAISWCTQGLVPGQRRRARCWYIWSEALFGWEPPYITVDYTEVNYRGWATRRSRKKEAA